MHSGAASGRLFEDCAGALANGEVAVDGGFTLMNAPQHPYRANLQTKLVALAVLVAALAAIFLVRSDAALAGRGLAVEVGNEQASETGGSVALQVNGARRARSVALFVDGSLRKRDRSWPWNFGSNGRVGLRGGEHEIVVAARFRRASQVRRATVQIGDRRHRANAPGRAPGVAGNQQVGSQPSRPVAATPPAAPSTPAGVDWQGDFETGDISQWDMIQQVAPDRITISQDPVREGNYAARFEVRPGDNIGDTPPRAELANHLDEQEGEERYYRWFTYFDPDFPTNRNAFITFTQWRAMDESDAYTSFMVWGDRIELRRDGTRWSTPLVRGEWQEFIYHVKWSPDPDVGFIELWHNGQLVMPKVYVETMAGSPGDAVPNYVKQGLYRADELPTGVVYHDGFTAGDSLAAVSGA